MRISFYGALLLAMSMLLLSYGGRTSGLNTARSATSDFTSVGVIVPDVSTDEFNDALATITVVELGHGDRGRLSVATDAEKSEAPAL